MTRADNPQGYTVEADNHGVHCVSSFSFASAGESATEVTMTFGGTPTKPQNAVMRAMGRLGFRMVRRTLEKDLADLAAAAEERVHGR